MSWLLGWHYGSVPGYTEIKINSDQYSQGPGYLSMPAMVADLHSQMSGDGHSIAIGADGRVTVTAGASPITVTWADRLGWLLGFGTEPAQTTTSATASVTGAVSPGIIPLYGAQWDGIALRQEVDLRSDRQLRGHGYAWGTAAIWNFTLTMSADAVAALQSGWCARGKITISPTLTLGNAWDATTDPGGYIDGHVLSIGPPQWQSDLRTVAVVELLLARAVES